MHVLEKSGRKHVSFKHENMVLDIFILMVFQVLAEFNRPHLPPIPDTNSEDEEMEGGTANEEPALFPVNSKIHI